MVKSNLETPETIEQIEARIDGMVGEEEAKTKRLVAQIPPELKATAKVTAFQHNITLTEFVILALENQIKAFSGSGSG